MYRWLSLLLLLTACSGNIDGFVFLDTNKNGLADAQENTLGQVALSVKHNGEIYTRTVTDENGQFIVKSKDVGYYCVTIEDPIIRKSVVNRLQDARVSIEKVSPVAVGPSVSAVVAKSLGQATDATSPPPTTPPASRKSGETCLQSDGSSFSVDVGVDLDYQAQSEEIPPTPKQSFKAGEEFEYTIYYPFGCTLATIIFPPDTFEILHAKIDLKKTVLKSVEPKFGRIEFRDDLLSNYAVIPLKVKNNIPAETSHVQINPEVTCPDGSTITLHSIEMDLTQADAKK